MNQNSEDFAGQEFLGAQKARAGHSKSVTAAQRVISHGTGNNAKRRRSGILAPLTVPPKQSWGGRSRRYYARREITPPFGGGILHRNWIRPRPVAVDGDGRGDATFLPHK